MPESQAHGKTWETSILSEVYNLSENELKSICYTSSHDLPSHLNRLDGALVSIKSSCNPNKIDMANPLRIFKSTGPFHMFVIFYKQDENVKRLNEIVKIDLTCSKNILFGENTLEDIQKLDELIKSVPIGRRNTPEEHRQIHKLKDRLNARSGALNFNPKLDGKNQRRLQCSFPRFQNFIESHPTRIMPVNIGASRIVKEIVSRPRQIRLGPR